jgi:hypothetical protein|tara:strand:+ start:19854 stop:20030 length:177 start_codon:yes stop_codon:yes gene_type:complete
MNIREAKKLANKSFSKWSGFETELPKDLLFTVAGNIKHNGWTDENMFAFFNKMFTKSI